MTDEETCKGCGNPLLAENAWMEDGCPCNSPKGCNDGNQQIDDWRHERDAPAWHERPTKPGLWLCWPDDKAGNPFPKPVAVEFTQDDLDRGAPWRAKAVFGPIPAPAHSP